MDTTRIGVLTVARSDWGITGLLVKALGAHVRNARGSYVGLDALILPTDRWEVGEVAMRALGAGLPIIQLHAGESTPFAFDDDIRHFISRVAALRFCCHDVHRQRLLGMGIPDATIHVCGAPGLDRLLGPRISREVLGRQLRLDPVRAWAIVILHPTTRGDADPEKEYRDAVEAVGDRQALWFTPCRDPGRNAYIHFRMIENVTDPQWRALLYEAEVLIGNSSALVIEAPFVGLKTVEIGRRQEGRERVPYGDGASVPRIVKILQEWTP